MGKNNSLAFFFFSSIALLYYIAMPLYAFDPEAIKGMFAKAEPLKPFELIDHHRNPVTIDSFKGHWSIVSIGYTNCPDICPATLSKYQHIQQILAKYQPGFLKETRFIFVSVDPHRDSPEHLKNYMTYFHPDFMGLTGDVINLQQFVDSIYASYIKPDTKTKHYEVAHSAGLHIINDQGQLQAIIKTPYTAVEAAASYINMRAYLNQLREGSDVK